MKTGIRRRKVPITAEEISEMEKMLNHLYFSTNKSTPSMIGITNLINQYSIRNIKDIQATLLKKNIIKKFGRSRSTSYKWSTSETPSKMMARRVIEENIKSREIKNKTSRDKASSIKISNSEEKITREEFEKRVEKINKETGMYAEEFKKIKELKGKQIKVEQPQPKHIAPIQKQETESVSLFWGLYTRTKNI